MSLGKELNPKPIKLLWALAILRLILPFVLQHSYYQPHRDEYLYLDYASHMDWGYMEVPPMLSIFSWLTLKLGNGFFWVKFWPALFGALTFFICGHLTLLLGGKSKAIFLLFICLVFGAFIRLFFLFQPGFLEVFSWTLIAYFFIRFQIEKKVKWLYLFGIACGIGMLSKYTSLFFITAIVAGFLVTKERSVITSKHFYIAALLAFLLFLPNLFWQYQHQFPVVTHMQELRETQLVNIKATDFLMGQLMMNFVVAFVWISGLIALIFFKKWKSYSWYGVGYCVLLILLIAGNGKDYYALGVYPILFAFGSVQLAHWAETKHKFVFPILLLIPVILGMFILPLGLPMFKPEKLARYYEKNGFTKAMGFKWEDQQNHPLPQDFADMIGWREIAEMTSNHYNTLNQSTKDSTIILCRGYYTAGALNFYGKKLGLPTAISTNGSYLLWIPETLKFKHILMVAHNQPDEDEMVFQHFEQSQILDSISIPYFREDGIRLFSFKNGNDSMRFYADQAINEMKHKFRRPN